MQEYNCATVFRNTVTRGIHYTFFKELVSSCGKEKVDLDSVGPRSLPCNNVRHCRLLGIIPPKEQYFLLVALSDDCAYGEKVATVAMEDTHYALLLVTKAVFEQRAQAKASVMT